MIAWGRVKLTYRHIDGKEIVLNIVGASDVFGEVTPFDYGTREFTASAVTEVCAVAIERDLTPGLDGRVPGNHPPDHASIGAAR